MEKERPPLTLNWKIRIYTVGAAMICAGIFCFYLSAQNSKNVILFMLIAIGLTLLGVKLINDTRRTKLVPAENIVPSTEMVIENTSPELKGAKTICKVVNAITIPLFFIVAFYKFAPPWVILAAILYPIICLAIIYRNLGLINLINTDKADTRPTLTLAFLLSACALAFRAGFVYDLVKTTDCILLVVAWFALTCSAIYIAHYLEPRFEYGSFAALAIVLLCYSYGSCININCAFDKASPVVYHPRILHRNISVGKHTRYFLTLESWGPRKDENDVTVPQWIYDRVNIGQSINVSLKPGVLEIPWYMVSDE